MREKEGTNGVDGHMREKKVEEVLVRGGVAGLSLGGADGEAMVERGA